MVAPLRRLCRQNLWHGDHGSFSLKSSCLAAGLLFSCRCFIRFGALSRRSIRGEKRLFSRLSRARRFFSAARILLQIVLGAFQYFIEQYGTMGVTPAIRIGEYFTFFFRMVLAFGATFELPVFTFFLVRLGIWDYRFMLRSFRYAIVVIFIIAAMLTPTPDIINQSLLALPMLALYVLSIGVAYVWRRRNDIQFFRRDDSTS
jgi:hypothetical protein